MAVERAACIVLTMVTIRVQKLVAKSPLRGSYVDPSVDDGDGDVVGCVDDQELEYC